MTPIQFPPIYSRGHLDGDTSKLYEFDTRWHDDPICTFVLLCSPRYAADGFTRMYCRTAHISRFTPITQEV
jgi:hypothetical protein